MTLANDQALVALYLLQDFRRVATVAPAPGPKWFHRHGVLTGLTAENRKATARLVRRTRCLSCDSELAADSTGDHLVALANGGDAGLANYVPLCGGCNSSKGTRDFLDWWQRRGRSPLDLPPDVLALYARLTFRLLRDRRRHGEPAPAWLVATIAGHIDALPSPEHADALWRRVQWVVGKEIA